GMRRLPGANETEAVGRVGSVAPLLIDEAPADKTSTPSGSRLPIHDPARELAVTRMKSLWKASPRKVLLAFGVLLVVAAVAVGSGANFNSTSANPSNVFTAGTISSSNSKASAAILTASNIVPGNTATGTVDIKNTGSANGTFTFTHTTPVDSPASPGLSKKLTLT